MPPTSQPASELVPINNGTAADPVEAELVEALVPDPAPAGLIGPDDEAALERLMAALARGAAYGELDLAVVAEKDLNEADTAYFYRLNWVISLVRLWHFLRRQPKDFDQEDRQAVVALGFLKHIESDEKRRLLLGRRKSDDTLAAQVDELTVKLTRIVEMKQKARNAQAPA